MVIMKIRRFIKFLAFWTLSWVIIGAVIGIVMGFGGTGHIGFFGTVCIVATAGAIFGFMGGIAFALVFTWLAPLLSTRLARVVIGAFLGILAGLVGILLADSAVGITHAPMIGSIAGGITGLVCGAFKDSKDSGDKILI
jgi:hypothetical protein